MSSAKELVKLGKEQGFAKVLEDVVPQMFSGPEVISSDKDGPAPDSGRTDYWMLTNIPADVLIPLIGLQLIGEQDKRDDVKKLVELVLRGVKGIGGFTAKQGESIALGLGGGVGKKIVKKPGWVGRNVTNRNYEEKAKAEGAEIEE